MCSMALLPRELVVWIIWASSARLMRSRESVRCARV